MDILPLEVKEELRGFQYIFNPSFCKMEKTEYWAFRCYSEASKDIECWIYILESDRSVFKKVNLNKLFRDRYNVRPADPKLFSIGEKVYCTLNTGYTFRKENEIYLIEINGHKVKPKKCMVNFARNIVEKNWMFFEFENNLMLLYSIGPNLTVAELIGQGSDYYLFGNRMEEYCCSRNYSIGTPIGRLSDSLYLVGHEKISIGKRRLYIGVGLRIEWRNRKRVVVGKRILHSPLSVLGNKFKFNKNLFSCTYFSGLQIDQESKTVLLGYGINDLGWNVVQLGMEKVWR